MLDTLDSTCLTLPRSSCACTTASLAVSSSRAALRRSFASTSSVASFIALAACESKELRGNQNRRKALGEASERLEHKAGRGVGAARVRYLADITLD